MMPEEIRLKAHDILKAWLQHNRFNRFQRSLGRAQMVTWRTNELPLAEGFSSKSGIAPEIEAFDQVMPSLHWIALRVLEDGKVADALLKIYDWAHRRGADVGFDASVLKGMRTVQLGKEVVQAALSSNPDAHFGMAVLNREAKNEGTIAFALLLGDITRSFEGTLTELAEKGFVIGINPDSGDLTFLDVKPPFLKQGRKFLRMHEWVILGTREVEALDQD